MQQKPKICHGKNRYCPRPACAAPRCRASAAPLVTDAGRCGHRPLRSSIGEWRCRGRRPRRPDPNFFRTRQGTRALPYKVLRYRGRADRVVRPYKPFRRAGCPHPAAQPCTALLAKTLSLRTSDRCHWCGNPSPSTFVQRYYGFPRPVCGLVSE